MSKAEQAPKGAEIEYLTGSDKLGRCRFFINWIGDDGKKRSRVFFADPNEYGFNRNQVEL